MTVIMSKERVAKKEHTCSFCGGTIKNGERYDYQKCRDDDGLYEWKSHLHCMSLVRHFDMMDYASDDGLTADDFREQIREIWDDEFSIAEKVEILYNKIMDTKLQNSYPSDLVNDNMDELLSDVPTKKVGE